MVSRNLTLNCDFPDFRDRPNEQSNAMLPTNYIRLAIWRTSRFLLTPSSSSVFSVNSSLSTSSDTPPPNEKSLIDQLRVKFPKATDIAVVDVSGGCGAMFEVFIEAPDFKGIRIVKQHQLVNEALKSQIKEMHGLRISTAVSPCCGTNS